MPRILLALTLALPLTAADPPEAVQKELARYDEAIAKLLKSYDEGLAKERAKSVPVLAAAAKKTLGSGDMPGAVEAWKCVLKLDRGHADARAFFTSINQLDQVLAELGGDPRTPAVDAMGDPLPQGSGTAMARGWKSVSIKAGPDNGVTLGMVRKGDQVVIQFQSGTWSRHELREPMTSPDSADPIDQNLRAGLFSGDHPVVALPGGTVREPFAWTASEDVAELVLRMIAPQPKRPAGEVTYKVRLQRAK